MTEQQPEAPYRQPELPDYQPRPGIVQASTALWLIRYACGCSEGARYQAELALTCYHHHRMPEPGELPTQAQVHSHHRLVLRLGHLCPPTKATP